MDKRSRFHIGCDPKYLLYHLLLRLVLLILCCHTIKWTEERIKIASYYCAWIGWNLLFHHSAYLGLRTLIVWNRQFSELKDRSLKLTSRGIWCWKDHFIRIWKHTIKHIKDTTNPRSSGLNKFLERRWRIRTAKYVI